MVGLFGFRTFIPPRVYGREKLTSSRVPQEIGTAPFPVEESFPRHSSGGCLLFPRVARFMSTPGPVASPLINMPSFYCKEGERTLGETGSDKGEETGRAVRERGNSDKCVRINGAWLWRHAINANSGEPSVKMVPRGGGWYSDGGGGGKARKKGKGRPATDGHGPQNACQCSQGKQLIFAVY